MFSVVLTEADGSRVYVSCMRWWERADDGLVKAWGGVGRERRGTVGKITEDGNLVPLSSSTTDRVLYAPKCLLLTSHWPFFTQMENYLTALYAFITPSSPTLPYPIERSLQNLITETPLPPPGQLQVESHPLPSLSLLFSRPPPNALPLQDFSTLYLFRLLSPDSVLTVFSAVSVEKRVLFISSHLHRLTLSAESLLSLLFPFFWRNIYIPLLPQQLLEFSCAPMPYIMGCPTPYKPDTELLDGVLVVDLDTNTVTWNGSVEERPPPLPPSRTPTLLKSLKRLFGDLTSPLRMGQVVDEEELHSTFVRFFAKLLTGYRDFLLPTTEDSADKFDRTGFLQQAGEDGKVSPALEDQHTAALHLSCDIVLTVLCPFCVCWPVVWCVRACIWWSCWILRCSAPSSTIAMRRGCEGCAGRPHLRRMDRQGVQSTHPLPLRHLSRPPP